MKSWGTLKCPQNDRPRPTLSKSISARQLSSREPSARRMSPYTKCSSNWPSSLPIPIRQARKKTSLKWLRTASSLDNVLQWPGPNLSKSNLGLLCQMYMVANSSSSSQSITICRIGLLGSNNSYIIISTITYLAIKLKNLAKHTKWIKD